MKLTQEYIDRKHEELMGRLEESVVKQIIDELQVRLELERIDEELSNDGPATNTTPTKGST